MISAARASCIGMPLRPLAASTIQRRARLSWRSNEISIGHLVGGATDAAALHLEAGTGVFQRAEQQVDRVALLELLGDLLEGTVDDALGKVLLAALHDDIDEVRDQRAACSGHPGRLGVSSAL